MTRCLWRTLSTCLLGAMLILTASCGGDSSSTAETNGSSSSEPVATQVPTTDPATTLAPETSVASSGGFNETILEAFRTGFELAQLRSECFAKTELGCLVSTEESIAAALEKVNAALESVGTASVEAGVEPKVCQERVATVVKNNSSEWTLLLERARADASGNRRFGEADWQYHQTKLGSEIGTPGHAVAGILLRCYVAVNKPTSELVTLVQNFVDFSDFARIAFSYNLLTQYLCVDDRDPTCFDGLGKPDDVGFGRGNLEASYPTLTVDPAFVNLPQECRDAIQEANTRLMSSLDNYLNVSKRELVSTDTELQSLLTVGVFQIDDQRRGTAPMYPFDEFMALDCAAAAIEVS